MDMDTVSSQLYSLTRNARSQESRDRADTDNDKVEQDRPGRRVRHAYGHAISNHGRSLKASRLQRETEDAAAISDTPVYRRSERTGLQLETQEGDKVHLKIKSTDSLAIDAGLQEDDENTVSTLDLQARSSTRISFTVKGDLNEAELAAIQSVIAQAGAMAEEFFSGNTADTFAAASELEIDATQLASVRLKMGSTEYLSYPLGGLLQGVATDQDAGNAAVATGETAGSAPAGDSEPVAVTKDIAPDSDVTANTGIAAAEATDTAETSADTAAGTEAAPVTADREQLMANVLQSIGDFLNRLMGTFGNTDGNGKQEAAPTEMTLKLQVFRSILLSVTERDAAVSGDDPATTLAAETVDAVNAQQTPLEEVA